MRRCSRHVGLRGDRRIADRHIPRLGPNTRAGQEADVTYPSGDITLAALRLIRVAVQPVPGVDIIQGSGTSDRTNQWAHAIADELVRNGVAVGHGLIDHATHRLAPLFLDTLAGC